MAFLVWALLLGALGLYLPQVGEVFGLWQPPAGRATPVMVPAALAALLLPLPFLGERWLDLLPVVAVAGAPWVLGAGMRALAQDEDRVAPVFFWELGGLAAGAVLVLPTVSRLGPPAAWLFRYPVVALMVAAALIASAGGTTFTLLCIGRLKAAVGSAPEPVAGPGPAPAAAPAAGELRLGRLIGVLERLLLLVFVLGAHFTAIAFVLTAKSVTRFSQLNDKKFAEYYLVGTLASTLWALLVGLGTVALRDQLGGS